jgi:hypothetical protein
MTKQVARTDQSIGAAGSNQSQSGGQRRIVARTRAGWFVSIGLVVLLGLSASWVITSEHQFTSHEIAGQTHADGDGRSPPSVPTLPQTALVEAAQTGAIEPPGIAKRLKLFAVYPGRTTDAGRATLGPAEASSRTYVVGAVLENGAKLTQVFDDRVVLALDRRTYTLYLQGRAGDTLPSDTPGLTVGAFAPPEPGLQPPSVRVTDYLRTVPAYNGDLILGFRAYPGSRAGQFDTWGLKAGDLLVSAGGVALSDPSQMEVVADQLAAGAVLTADVVREGHERRRVTLDGAALLAASTPPPPPSPPLQ